MPVDRGPNRGGAAPPSGRRTAALAVPLLLGALVAGCTSGPPTPAPDNGGAAAAAAALAAGLASQELDPLPFLGATGGEVDGQLAPLVRGMGPLRAAVTVRAVDVPGDTATATLAWRWTFPGVPAAWTYDTRAELVREAGTWRTRWLPSVVEPSLDGGHRLSSRRLYPDRGLVLGDDGDALVTSRPVVRIGIDRSRVPASRAAASARRLARLVGVDAADFATRVAAAGPDAFVEAITFRADDRARPASSRVTAIRGALAINDRQMLAPTRTFARPVLGTVGEATADEVDASDGAVVAGDQVGRSGLQKRYDEQLRGTPGVQVVRVPLPGAGGPSASPTPSPTDPAPAGSAPPVVLHRAEPTAGRDLEITLNRGLQGLAERVLADTRPASALVAVRPSSGALVAVASGPGSRDQSVATVGQYAPGSTFKVVSALALLRAGLRPGSSVACPATTTVDGRRFENYDDYPRAQRGRITLQRALAHSCNTAFIGRRGELGAADLAEAAGSLGLGADYDVGFPAFFGSVPKESKATGQAAAMIGQGRVQASPLAMAAVTASVARGATVVPHLVTDEQASPRGAPLTRSEAADLRQMMRAVVSEGSAGGVLGGLDGPAVLAKTGTAEYGDDDPPATHAWMVAAQGDLAVAVFVADGDSGSTTAGPLLAQFLRGAR